MSVSRALLVLHEQDHAELQSSASGSITDTLGHLEDINRSLPSQVAPQGIVTEHNNLTIAAIKSTSSKCDMGVATNIQISGGRIG